MALVSGEDKSGDSVRIIIETEISPSLSVSLTLTHTHTHTCMHMHACSGNSES